MTSNTAPATGAPSGVCRSTERLRRALIGLGPLPSISVAAELIERAEADGPAAALEWLRSTVSPVELEMPSLMDAEAAPGIH